MLTGFNTKGPVKFQPILSGRGYRKSRLLYVIARGKVNAPTATRRSAVEILPIAA
jgi:hypothetical protein